MASHGVSTMQTPIAALARARRRAGCLALVGLGVLALLALTAGGRLVSGGAGGAQPGATPMLLNPCNGETIALQDSAHLLPHLAPDQLGSGELSVNAVGMSGRGSRGTFYLPMGTGKVVLTIANGTFDLATGGDLELIGRGNQGQDFLFHGIAHLRAGLTSGLRGSGVTLQARCA